MNDLPDPVSEERGKCLAELLELRWLTAESGLYTGVAHSAIRVQETGETTPLRASNSIYYLLNREFPINYIHWLKSDDTHILCEGGPVDYYLFAEDGTASHEVLGSAIAAGEQLIMPVRGGYRKAVVLRSGIAYALMGCVVTPAWAPDRVVIGAGNAFLQKYVGAADWATEAFLRELIGPNFLR